MLRFGLVGYGQHAKWAVHQALQKHAQHGKLVAVADLLAENLAAVGNPGIATYTDYRQMIDREALDALYVATGPEAHAAPTIYGLEAGLHVICEKPMAANADECRAMVAAAERSARILAIDFENRFMTHTNQVKAWIDAGYLGKVRAFHFQQMWDGHKAFGPIAARRARLTNAAGSLDCSIHELDLARYWSGGGEWREIQAMGMWFGEDLVRAPHISLLAQLSSGALVTLNSSFAYTAYIEPRATSDVITIVGTEGVINHFASEEGISGLKLTSRQLTDTCPMAHVPHYTAIGWVVDELADLVEGRIASSSRLATGVDGWMAQIITDEANRQCIARRMD